jgi:phosphoribosylamine-glycine ligase
MYIYNVTTNIQEDIHEEWVQWMKKEHIPDMLQTKKFTKALMSRVVVEEPMGGITYSVQYTCINKEILQKYYEEDAKDLRSRSKAFEGKFVAFRTELEVVSEHKE